MVAPINYFQQLGFAQPTLAQQTQYFANIDRNAQERQMNDLNIQGMREGLADAKTARERQAIQFKDAQEQAEALAAQQKLYSALSAGDIEGADAIITTYSSKIEELGGAGAAERARQMLRTPEGMEKIKASALNAIQMAAGPEQFARFTAQQEGIGNRQVPPAKVQEFEYWKQMNPDATPEQQRQFLNTILDPYSRAMATGQARVETEQQLNPVLAQREAEKAGALEQTAGGQTKLQQDEIALREAQAKINQQQATQQQRVNLSRETMQLAREIANDAKLDSVTGVGAMTPTIMPESQDLILKAERLNALLTADNLKLMSGVLTDKDIQMLQTLSSGMRVTDKGIRGSASAIRNRLNTIANNIEKALGGQHQSQPQNGTRNEAEIFKEYGL